MTNNFETASTIDAQRCPGCGAMNDCAIARGEQQCWCMAEPVGISLPTASAVSNFAGASCYCQDCLRALSSSKNQTKE